MTAVRITADGTRRKTITVYDRRTRLPVDLPGVRSAVLNLGSPGEMPVLTVELLVPALSAVHGGPVELPEATRAALLALGWTPPADPDGTA
ncbi:hypothetical protein JNW90_10760 [Micromonospora sp. STR1s_5]|nr:hypothetical protein [Micromonospora sp. STR1s_5]